MKGKKWISSLVGRQYSFQDKNGKEYYAYVSSWICTPFPLNLKFYCEWAIKNDFIEKVRFQINRRIYEAWTSTRERPFHVEHISTHPNTSWAHETPSLLCVQYIQYIHETQREMHPTLSGQIHLSIR